MRPQRLICPEEDQKPAPEQLTHWVGEPQRGVRGLRGHAVSAFVPEPNPKCRRRCFGARQIALLNVLVLPCLLLFACALSPPATAGTKPSVSSQLVLYATGASEEFINSNDDEARGDTNNPFGIRPLSPAALQRVDQGSGPFPGDYALFTLRLHTDAALKTRAGLETLTCFYLFAKDAFCDVTLNLADGNLVASGVFSFAAKSYALAVTGGTGRFNGASGELDVSPAAGDAEKIAVLLGAGASRALVGSGLTVYALTAKEQFVDHQDDRSRGEGNNPFGNYAANSGALPTNEAAFGPFVGDDGLFADILYAQKSLKSRIGSAEYSCQYIFNKEGACDVVVSLNGGEVVAFGAFGFNTGTFVLAIVGGTGKFVDAHGNIFAQQTEVTRTDEKVETQLRLTFAA